MKVIRQADLPDGCASWAAFDADERYRYDLGRVWDDMLPPVTFVMLNPSTADAFKNDATILKCCGFARMWGHGGIRVVNLFAHRARDPKELSAAADPIGPENADAFKDAFEWTGAVCVAWGAFKHPLLEQQAELALRLATDARVPICALRVTKTGRPEHPLYVPYSVVPSPWPAIVSPLLVDTNAGEHRRRS